MAHDLSCANNVLALELRGKFFMKKIKLLVAALGVSLVAMFALAPAAQAQNVASIIADPAFVAAPGETTFTITGSGWPAGATALLPCEGSTNYEEAAANGADACDLGNLTIVTAAADGTFTAEWTYNIPAAGMCIGAGDLAQTTVGTYCVGVGAPILPNTGSESTKIAIIGAAVLAAGAMIVLSTRRRSFVS